MYKKKQRTCRKKPKTNRKKMMAKIGITEFTFLFSQFTATVNKKEKGKIRRKLSRKTKE